MQANEKGMKGCKSLKKTLVLVAVFVACSFGFNMLAGLDNDVSAASLSTSKVGSYSIGGTAQSMAYDSDKNRIVVFSPAGNAIIIDGSSFKRTGSKSFSGGGHCNGATYNPTQKVFAVAPTKAHYAGGYYIYDSESVSKKGTIHANPGGAIAFSRKKGAYYASGKGNFRTIKCKNATGNCRVSNKFSLSLSGGDQQDAETYGKYYYLCTSRSGASNTIHKIDMETHKKVESFSVSGPELEGMIFIGEKAYTLHHHPGGGSFSIYKVSDDGNKKLLSGAGDNGFDGSNSNSSGTEPNRTVAGTTKPKDISKYKNAMKASKKKKLKKRAPEELKNTTNGPCTSILPEAWCKDDSAIFKLINLFAYIITAGVGILGMAGIVWMSLIYMTAGDSAERARLAKRRLLEIVIGMILWGLFFALVRWILMGKIV